MQITNPITVSPPPINGKIVPPFTFRNNLPVRWVDDPDAKQVRAIIRGVPKPLVLWQGAGYDSIGNWTESQAEAQVTTLLGSNPGQVIEGLFQ